MRLLILILVRGSVPAPILHYFQVSTASLLPARLTRRRSLPESCNPCDRTTRVRSSSCTGKPLDQQENQSLSHSCNSRDMPLNERAPTCSCCDQKAIRKSQSLTKLHSTPARTHCSVLHWPGSHGIVRPIPKNDHLPQWGSRHHIKSTSFSPLTSSR